MDTRFKIGDRVIRFVDIHDDKSNIKHGTVTEVYSKTTKNPQNPTKNWFYAELYEVLWDSPYSNFERGFMAHGLDPDKK